jgi:proteasome lid subunit RPN8/RPN11
MLTIHLPHEVSDKIAAACTRARIRETGGMLFGEHIADEEFRVADATVAGQGSFASFVRAFTDVIGLLENFFVQTKRDYQRFNYLGEWHSHPSFALIPSGTDDSTMRAIVNDPSTNARFAVAIIVKLVDNRLHAAAFAYFPDGKREGCRVVYDL